MRTGCVCMCTIQIILTPREASLAISNINTETMRLEAHYGHPVPRAEELYAIRRKIANASDSTNQIVLSLTSREADLLLANFSADIMHLQYRDGHIYKRIEELCIIRSKIIIARDSKEEDENEVI